ncbi:polyamine aminopropyltransferase [Kroppenstedtia guangzhouensis]|uniref:Polyamine aminopropyltransferase n=1 Tax=Kroppenstedtia guangzhouensis TaxID=1274356 RepID=A0ABQ1H1X6_9BACL|nr:polyamine aminopropyltransferase [Kroppenstedtia guangzhouensis]GGA54848.1 polyamine aminopropyltransferase [Kroppenstedtia guangzhouensis]
MDNKKMTGSGFFTAEDGTQWLSDPEERFGFRASWKINRFLHREQSEFQDVAVVETEGFGKTLVLDEIVQTTEADGFIYNEMITHIPLATHPSPREVCIIGGGDCGAAGEAVKYPSVQRVDLVEIDRKVVEVSRKYLPEVAGVGALDPRIHLHYEDGTSFIREKESVYDVVVVDSSDPVGPAAVLFELPFYRDVHRALKADGLMVCQSESPVFHPGVLSRVHQTLRQLFPVVRTYLATVPTYPGGVWSFTLASKTYDPLREGSGRLQTRGNRYVDGNVLEGSFRLPVYVKELLGKC